MMYELQVEAKHSGVSVSNWSMHILVILFRDRNWEVQAGSPDKIFDKKCLYV
jgi:hypothetical protein